MYKLLLIVPALFMLSISSYAQTKAESVEKESSVESINKMVVPQFKTTSTPVANVNATNQVLLQELYLIEDERQRIEKDQSLTQSERSQKTQVNNAAYINKKQEFMTYVASKGILNVSKQEQNYYLYLLKYDKKLEEYTENINLIKNSK